MSEQTMAGRTVLVTGASDGIGAETARVLASKGATVLVTGRSAEKLRPVAEAVGTDPLIADFSRLDDVRRLADQLNERVDKIDVLMNNAGGTFAPSKKTHDGHEPNFQINHLAPFLLTQLLRPKLATAGSSLVVNTSSIGNLMGKIVLHPRDQPALGRRRNLLGRRTSRPGRQLVRPRLMVHRHPLPLTVQAPRHDQRS
jgi:NAD(P)-dependent dehydrogenase (short-subunit alcohol dehydrogenase family)